MIRAGNLRHKVTVQQLVAGSPQQKASGEPDETWTTVATVWASIEPLRGREVLTAQQFGSEVKVRIRMRYCTLVADITAAMRVVYDGKYYGIVAVIDPMLKHREIELMCTQGLNDG